MRDPFDEARRQLRHRNVDPDGRIDEQIRAAVGAARPEPAAEPEDLEATRPPGRPKERLRGPDGQYIADASKPVDHLQSGSVGPPKALTVDEWIRRAAGY